jgi:hypothetical protein
MSKNESRSLQILVKEAELLNGTNDFVYKYFVDKVNTEERIEVDDLDSETELNLLSKNDNFIDITLAQYCRFSETIAQLFSKSKATNNFALRLACLSNKTIGRTRWSFTSLPVALFSDEKSSELTEWFATITDAELDALFRNETIDDDFLTKFLSSEDNKLWTLLSEDKQLTVIRALYYNNRVCLRYKGPMDGYAEYLHGKLFSVIWDLAKTLPVTGKWARALGFLLDKTRDSRFNFDSLEVAKRWNVVDENEKEGDKKLFLNAFESVRCAIYKDVIKDLYGKDNSNKTHFANEDLAYRACAYEKLNLITVEDIKEAYAKDKLIAIEHLMKNLTVWRKIDLRKALHDICWDADENINNNYLDCANNYNWKEEELTKLYPDWFADKEDDSFVDEDEAVLTLGMARGLLQEANYQQSVEILNEVLAIRESLTTQKATLKLVSYAVIGLVLFAFFKH